MEQYDIKQLELTVKELLKVILVPTVDTKTLTLDDDLRLYGMNSQRSIRLIVNLEDELGISVLDEKMDSLYTISQIIQLVINIDSKIIDN